MWFGRGGGVCFVVPPLGVHGADGVMHTSDLHATLLALLGLNHEQLTYPYGGRDFRLTDVAGYAAKEILACVERGWRRSFGT